jgi:anthranilate phosphoribosyltransferase
MVVHSEDGMDEISIGAATKVAELKNGAIKTYTIFPEDFDMRRDDLKHLVVDSAEQSLGMIKLVFEGHTGPARVIVALNAGAAIYVAGLAESHEAGVKKAQQVIDSGAAMNKLNELVTLTRSFK